MVSTEGLVPITRAYLASYYDKYPFDALSDDVASLSTQIRSFISDLQSVSPLTEDERIVVEHVDREPPHKIDENMWKNREHMEEIVYLLDRSHWPSTLQQQSTSEDAEIASTVGQLKDKFEKTTKTLEYFQKTNADYVFNTVMTYMPQDFRGTLIRQQRERSERNKQAEVDALVQAGGSIRDRYALLWKQQMERRRQLAQLGSATGVYKTLVKYLVGVPQVLLDFIKQINDDDGPMEEQRHRYGPPLYSLTKMVLTIRLFLFLLWARYDTRKMTTDELSVLEKAVNVYATEFERFIKFLGEVFANAPFFVSAEEVGAAESGKNDDYKEISIPAGKIHEVVLPVDSINSYIAWDFSLDQSKLKLDVGFSVEYTNSSGEKILILPQRRCESDQGNFCTVMAGNYKLIWDNSYSTFFSKALRYKVDCIPPVIEPAPGMEVPVEE
uniref:GOLD domain-containing protein n=1 Tax=Opuntia streptacantha TaxID=393608 RepID=A0A7C8YM05_OPUST